MKKESGKRIEDDLRPEYDLSQLKGGVRGKYYRQAMAGTNLMLIEPELAEVFPDAESVNRALRFLADTAEAAAGPLIIYLNLPQLRLASCSARFWLTATGDLRECGHEHPTRGIRAQEVHLGESRPL